MYICKNAIIYGDLMAKKAEFYASSFYGKGQNGILELESLEW